MAQAQGNNDTSMDQVWTIVLILVFIAGIWHFWYAEIFVFFSWVWRAEALLISPFTDRLAWVTPWMASADPKNVDFEKFSEVSAAIGSVTRYITIPVLAGLAAVLFIRAPHESHKHRFDMRSFARLQSSMWPRISPALKMDLMKQDPDKGPWASAMRTRDFTKKYGLIGQGDELDREKSERVFSAQLGALCHGVDTMPPHMRALVALFTMRIENDRAGYDALCDKLASSYAAGKIDYSGVENVLKKFAGHKFHKMLSARHAYQRTWMISLLLRARKTGVLAPNDFLWLKPVDRTLWYSLHNTGMRVSGFDAAGVRAHWLAEMAAGRSLEAPVVMEAVIALAEALKEISEKPEDDFI